MTLVVSQLTEYGANVSSAPIATPSTRNCTPATPALSAASAVSTTSPLRAAPSAGAVIVTVGGVVSAGPPGLCVMVSTPSAHPAVKAIVTVVDGCTQFVA